MEGIRQYLLSITAAAIICGILTSLLGKKGAMGTIIKLLAGLFLCVTVIRPVATIQIASFTGYTDTITADASLAAEAGAEATRKAMAERIKAQVEAYILDKAADWNAELAVEVILSDSDPPIPVRIHLTGAISPYAKTRLSQMIETDLGIPKEEQIWTG